MATKKYRVSKIQEILNLCKQIGVDITEEQVDNTDRSGEMHTIKFEGLSKEQKVEKLLEIINHELMTIGATVDSSKMATLQTKLLQTSVHNLKIIRSRLIHLRKLSWADMAESDSD